MGCGPVGLLCVQAAQLFAPAAVVAVDGVGYRRERARAFGALPAADPDEAARLVRELSGGRGADAVLEAVGAARALDLAIRLARPGATVSIAGYHTADVYPLPIQAAYGKNLAFKIGRCHARALHRRAVAAGARRSLPPHRDHHATSCRWPTARAPTSSSPSAARMRSRCS